MRIQVIFGIIWIFTVGAMGLTFQDPVVCKFKEMTQCSVALGKIIHLQMVEEDLFSLILSSITSDSHFILQYTKSHPNSHKPKSPRWQFVNDNKTLILTRAEMSDSGKYTLVVSDPAMNIRELYSLQMNVEAEVSSVKVSYSCLSPWIRKVHCSADGDNLRFSWKSDLYPVTQLEDGNRTFLLEQIRGKVTCLVENNVSSTENSTNLYPCLLNNFTETNTGFMVFVSIWLFEVIVLVSILVGAFYFYIRIYTKRLTDDYEAP